MSVSVASAKKNGKIILFLAAAFFIFFGLFDNFPVSANAAVDYGGEVITDSDLDGLTDLGEKNIFRTDPQNPDSDGDGFLDGAEVIAKTDYSDSRSPLAERVVTSISYPQPFVPSWGWYATRASALVGFILLYFSMFVGLAIRIPGLRKIFASPLFCRSHCWISLQALIFALVHAVSLFFDNFLDLGAKEIFVPFAFQPGDDLVLLGISSRWVALGIIGFYLMLMLVVSSYLRKFIGQKVWRWLHFANIALYVLVVIHALMLGTDLKIGMVRNVFFTLNGILAIMVFLNYIIRLKSKFRSSSDKAEYENQDSCEIPVVEKQGQQD